VLVAALAGAPEIGIAHLGRRRRSPGSRRRIGHESSVIGFGQGCHCM
jgi:hypothetical protein